MSKVDRLQDIYIEVDEVKDEAQRLRETIKEIEAELAELVEGAENLLEEADTIADNADDDEGSELDRERRYIRDLVEEVQEV